MRRIGTFFQKPTWLTQRATSSFVSLLPNADLVLSGPSHQEKILLMEWWFSEQFRYVDDIINNRCCSMYSSPPSSYTLFTLWSFIFFFFFSFFLFCSSSFPRLILRLLYSYSSLPSTTAWATQLCPGSDKNTRMPQTRFEITNPGFN
jgi:hypothetical protein